VGLHHWTVELPTAADVDAVADRARAAGLTVAPHTDGFIVRDPWDAAVAFVAG
jgi:pyruvate-formate lyase-activating enzyme